MRRSTIVFLLLFIVLAGGYYYLDNREPPADITVTLEPESQTSYLFTAEDGLPTRIRMEAKTGEKVEVARDADGAWALTLPVEAQADQAAAEAAASQVTTLRVVDTVPDVDAEIVGLATPEYTLTIQFTSDMERKAEIGVITPTESGYYVRRADGAIVIVSKSSVDSLLALLTNPPYLETPVPGPIPTESPLPSTAETGSAPLETATPVP
ncbi:MAG TPA: DUF4340 domain-containing protein [Anaerolineales bacterium]